MMMSTSMKMLIKKSMKKMKYTLMNPVMCMLPPATSHAI
jgi:hypothetical protein